MSVLGVIPARYGSVRLPAKPLKNILGRPLLSWVIEGVQSSEKIDQFVVATDHADIAALAEKCGMEAVMTSPDHPSRSDRVWEVAAQKDCDIVLNIQGDEPLVSGALLDELATPLIEDATIDMATLGRELKPGDLEAATTAKIVLNHSQQALYFSRHPIPYSRQTPADVAGACLKHIGLYAYRKTFLKTFCEAGPADIELAEGLEQLRALYLGASIHVVKVDHESWGVDTEDDVAKIEKLLEGRQHGR